MSEEELPKGIRTTMMVGSVDFYSHAREATDDILEYLCMPEIDFETLNSFIFKTIIDFGNHIETKAIAGYIENPDKLIIIDLDGKTRENFTHSNEV